MKNWNIKYRILFLAMFPVVVISALLSILVVIGGIAEMDSTLKSRGMLIARQLAPASEYGAFSGNREILQALSQALMKEEDVNAIIITDDRDKILAVSGHPSHFDYKSAGLVGVGQFDSTGKDSLVFAAQIYQNKNDIDEYGLVDYAKPPAADKKKVLGRVYVELSTAATQQRKNHFILISITIGLLGFFGALLLALRMSRDVTHPLLRLLDAVVRMTHGKLDARVAVDSGGELAKLEQGFNEMAGELQSAYSDMQERIEERTRDLARLKDEAEKAKASAEMANQAKSQFLAHISHEIRTPLNGLIGFLGLMGKTRIDDVQQDYLNICETSSRSLLAIINDILDLSKIEAGKLSIECLAFDLGYLIEQCILFYTPSAQSKGLRLILEIDRDIPVNLIGDPSRIRQILANLLGNAIKFTHSGVITVTVKHLDGGDGSTQVEISVADTGIGITDEQLGQLFQPFSQGDASITRRYGGTGLGLAITRRLVEMMNGTIAVESESGKGSRFTISLCLKEAGGDTALLPSRPVESQVVSTHFPLPGEEENPLPDQLRILVVDDNEINRKLNLILLRQWGVAVDEAADGVAAMAACGRQHYDLILMDVHMPTMDGIEATRRIRMLQEGGKQTPIVALTANALSGDRERYLAAGMDDYLEKPLTEEALRKAIEKWCLLPPLGVQDAGKKEEWTVEEYFPDSPHSDLPIIDAELGMERAGGCRQDWLASLRMQLAELPSCLDSFETAYSAADLEKVEELAHRLRGGALYCGISALEIAALRLEVACRNRAPDVADKLALLQQEAESLLTLEASGAIPEA
ncbi:integral membrane sensor hybrid histidine kinase [Sulfuricella denitrificans skB26]|uniref:Sensory/regulatory protein RpfC n=1 Tax=Sulfuricella denitrificans (strain DSM 22764 / NBRC 105220 / skB26) TaxID=1163617 RepID=S6AI57_SULDS|nr:ATP-binding protein [Sulfuricella denitrificans]BAN35886.1 integral membrane sensor hybrid histidine kinase [Sulfuricella denitrificans skB26]